jgi:hypothetical protein
MFEWLKPKSSGASQGAPPLKKDKSALIKEAMINARQARETIGAETLDRVLDIMNKKKQAQENGVNPAEQAKKIMREMDKGLLSDHLKDLMYSERTPPTKQ